MNNVFDISEITIDDAREFKNSVIALREQGVKDQTKIAEHFGMSVKEYRSILAKTNVLVDRDDCRRIKELISENYSMKEIAGVLNCSESRVRRLSAY